MTKNYIKIAFRNLTRSKGYSLINIIGLAAGMSVTMLIGMWVYDEISYNTYHKNYSSIAQVYQHQTANGEITTSPAGPMPISQELRRNYKSDFKHIVRSWWESNHTLSIDDKKISRNGTFMDDGALEMFSFNMVKGSWTSLEEPSSIVISESTAKAIFGDADPIGKSLRVDNMMDVKVTGVYEQLSHNSRLHDLQFISTWKAWVSANDDWMEESENDWNSTINTFVQLHSNATFDAVSQKIKDIKNNKITKEQIEQEKPQLFLQPMSRWHLYSEWKNGRETGGRVQFVWLFGIIGLFVLILACINFMNLATAQSSKRAKEVGIRKAIGSSREQLVYQFMAQSFLVVILSFVLSLSVVAISLPWFNELADKKVDILWTNLNFWLISLAFIFITGLLSGSYPALYLSSFQPVKVLKGTFKAGRFAAIPRKALVVLQFTVSVALIIGTFIVWQQIQYAKNRPVGYTREGLIMIRKNSPEFWWKFDALKNELKKSGAIIEMAESASPATDIWYTNKGFSWKGKDPNRQDDFATMAVTHEYGRTMGWSFIHGRDFSRDFSTDSSGMILNETAVRLMGLKEPVNEEITWNGRKFTVIGVIKDMIMTSPFEPVKQTIFWIDYKDNVWINIRINPSLPSNEALAKIENVFQDILPAVPFDYKFTDQEYALKFSHEERVGKLASLFATLAIFISCLGLFGMASFTAEQRKKEIGIRKILGASVTNLWTMLSGEFVLLVSISCLTAIPIAWYFLHAWLMNYEYHAEISIWVFVLASAAALLITVLTVSFQTLQASITNPVKALRSE